MGTVMPVDKNERIDGVSIDQEAVRQRFNTIVETMRDGILILDHAGKILYNNPSADDLFNIQPGELIGMELDIPMLEDGTTAEIEILRKSRDHGFAEVRVQSTTWEGQEDSLVILSDITERKRQEEDVQSARSFLETVIEMSPFAMWISDRDGYVIRTNRALRSLIDLTDEQILGNYNVLKDANLKLQGVLRQARSVFDNHETARFSFLWKAMETGYFDFRDDRDHYIDASMFPICNASGALTHVVCLWVDITERKQAETALGASHVLLQSLLAGTTFSCCKAIYELTFHSR